jgi:hypothetical protein
MMPAYAVLILLAFIFGPLVCAWLGDWLFGDPLAGGLILLAAIVLAMVAGGWRELTGR